MGLEDRLTGRLNEAWKRGDMPATIALIRDKKLTGAQCDQVLAAYEALYHARDTRKHVSLIQAEYFSPLFERRLLQKPTIQWIVNTPTPQAKHFTLQLLDRLQRWKQLPDRKRYREQMIDALEDCVLMKDPEVRAAAAMFRGDWEEVGRLGADEPGPTARAGRILTEPKETERLADLLTDKGVPALDRLLAEKKTVHTPVEIAAIRRIVTSIDEIATLVGHTRRRTLGDAAGIVACRAAELLDGREHPFLLEVTKGDLELRKRLLKMNIHEEIRVEFLKDLFASKDLFDRYDAVRGFGALSKPGTLLQDAFTAELKRGASPVWAKEAADEAKEGKGWILLYLDSPQICDSIAAIVREKKGTKAVERMKTEEVEKRYRQLMGNVSRLPKKLEGLPVLEKRRVTNAPPIYK